jgi:hypothetical protein
LAWGNVFESKGGHDERIVGNSSGIGNTRLARGAKEKSREEKSSTQEKSREESGTQEKSRAQARGATAAPTAAPTAAAFCRACPAACSDISLGTWQIDAFVGKVDAGRGAPAPSGSIQEQAETRQKKSQATSSSRALTCQASASRKARTTIQPFAAPRAARQAGGRPDATAAANSQHLRGGGETRGARAAAETHAAYRPRDFAFPGERQVCR